MKNVGKSANEEMCIQATPEPCRIAAVSASGSSMIIKLNVSPLDNHSKIEVRDLDQL